MKPQNVVEPMDEQVEPGLVVQQPHLSPTEQQVVPGGDRMARRKWHPSNYPPDVDVRPRASTNDSDGSDTV